MGVHGQELCDCSRTRRSGRALSSRHCRPPPCHRCEARACSPTRLLRACSPHTSPVASSLGTCSRDPTRTSAGRRSRASRRCGLTRIRSSWATRLTFSSSPRRCYRWSSPCMQRWARHNSDSLPGMHARRHVREEACMRARKHAHACTEACSRHPIPRRHPTPPSHAAILVSLHGTSAWARL
jgi:hypothetical protein